MSAQPETEPAVDLDAIRARLSRARGEAYWHALADLARSPAVLRRLAQELPDQAGALAAGLERRDFLHLMGASLALAGLGSCTRQPDESILPYAKNPEASVPGVPRYYATAMPGPGAGLGLLVESHMGRPTKVEGNPDHPTSLGATNALAQASVLSLYDPDRAKVVLRDGRISTFDAFAAALAAELERRPDGEGLRVLTPAVLSPTLGAALARLLALRPRARWHRWEPVHRDSERAGALAVYGRDVDVRLALERADLVVALEADLFGDGAAGVRYARDVAARRRVRAASRTMARLYAVESTVTITGAAADHRLALRPSEIEPLVRTLARRLGIAVDAGPPLQGQRARFVEALARDLEAHRGSSALVAGRAAPAAVHALVHRVNARLGNLGRTVEPIEPLEVDPVDCARSIAELAEDAREGSVQTLVVLGGNPVFDAPADVGFAEAVEGVPFRAHLSLHEDETSERCHWHVDAAHALESWGDVRGHDGTVSIVQPLIAPLYGGKSDLDLVHALLGEPTTSAYDAVRAHWRAAWGLADDERAFEPRWARALHDGVVAGSRPAGLDLAPRDVDHGPCPLPASGPELALRPDPSVWDGRFANNGWLQELPRPLTRLTWGNAALLGPRTAERLGVGRGDVLALAAGQQRVDAPAWIVPGHPEEVVTLHLGYGRRRAGHVGDGVGVDAYPLREGAAPWARAITLARGVGTRALACVQEHQRTEGRDLVRRADVAEFREDPKLFDRGEGGHAGAGAESGPESLSLYPDRPYDGYAWGMVIDLGACIGCNACMVACQAENNVPVVGAEEVARGREMHWLRVDLYYEGADDAPRVLHQPVPCMHCENAPCEVVCPVGATVHSPEGLNEMVYNRCVGTRYCSNNCPYKVRRFNFFSYAADAPNDAEVLELGRNPDVTVRSRGVMEKCTYCVQRINEARISAQREDRTIRDGEVVTACQGACPTRAITFGDLNDESAAVAHERREPHNYGLLAELGTRPRTTYLARFGNPNPELEG